MKQKPNKLALFAFGIASVACFSFNAIAQEAPAAAPAKGPDYTSFIGILLMFAVFFFLIILPQQRKAKKQAQFLSSLKTGDLVVTTSGLYGKIHDLADRVVTLEIAQGIRIRVDRQAIAGLESSDSTTKAA